MKKLNDYERVANGWYLIGMFYRCRISRQFDDYEASVKGNKRLTRKEIRSIRKCTPYAKVWIVRQWGRLKKKSDKK